MLSWLEDVVLVNENNPPQEPGDVQIFRTSGDACGWLEPWWVEGNEGMAMSAAGQELVLSASQTQVTIQERRLIEDGDRLVMNWLTATAKSVQATRRHRASKGKLVLGDVEAKGALPTTVEGLIAFVGFTR